MADTKHTPGPWRVEQDTTLVWGACNPDDNSTRGMGYPIAEAALTRPYWAGGNRMEDEAVANARLIAAAPDLLASLKYAVENIQGIADGTDIPSTAIRAHALEAIAKAEGRHA